MTLKSNKNITINDKIKRIINIISYEILSNDKECNKICFLFKKFPPHNYESDVVFMSIRNKYINILKNIYSNPKLNKYFRIDDKKFLSILKKNQYINPIILAKYYPNKLVKLDKLNLKLDKYFSKFEIKINHIFDSYISNDVDYQLLIYSIYIEILKLYHDTIELGFFNFDEIIKDIMYYYLDYDSMFDYFIV
jgi:hypothetical protein